MNHPLSTAALSLDVKFYKSPAEVHDFPSAGKGRTLITCDRLCSTEAQPLPAA